MKSKKRAQLQKQQQLPQPTEPYKLCGEESDYGYYCYQGEPVYASVEPRRRIGSSLRRFVLSSFQPSRDSVHDSEQSVASARAAVLVYDDHNKKWVPSGTSSGLSKVHIYQHTVNGTFRIVGRKLHDHEVVINCAILKGLKYSQATGTFHQWRDNRTVYGLNFSSKDDADNFAVAMLRAIDMLNQNSSTGPRVQQAPPPVPQHAPQHAPQHVSQQPIYQTIGTVASSQEDTEHQRNWQNQQPVHYMATNAVGSSSHPATPASGPPQAPPPPQAQPQPPQQPQSAVVMGHHRTSSAPGANGVAPPPPPPAGTSGMSVAVGSMTGVPPPGPPAPPSSGGPTTGAPPPPPPPPPPGGSQGRDEDGSPLSLASALANAKLKKTSNKVRTSPWWTPIYEGTDTLKKSQGGGSGSGGVPMMGMASMMDEMRGTLAKRRAQAENSQSQEAESSTDSRKAWDKQGTTNGNSPSKVAASGAESPKSGRGQRIGSLGDTDVVKVNGVDALDVDKLKQEIMSEIRREVSKMKQEIIEAIKIELNRR